MAPWSARHALKRAAEAAQRNASPPLPGSARATLRTPDGAEQLKARITDLSAIVGRLRSLRRTLTKDFWEFSCALVSLNERKLHEAKGYASFDAFLERELQIGRATGQRILRISQVFQESAAQNIGFAKLMSALESFENESDGSTRMPVAVAAKPLKPPAALRG